ncbi:MAG: hypothetical protein V1672_05050 [Candidatus Diapherotrites archaeon]
MLTASVNKIALDTSILLDAIEFKVDVFTEIKNKLGDVEFIVPAQIMKELDEISKRDEKKKRQIMLIKEIMNKNGVKIVKCEAKNADLALEMLSQTAIIATNDKELRKRIKSVNNKIIFLRKQKYIDLE